MEAARFHEKFVNFEQGETRKRLRNMVKARMNETDCCVLYTDCCKNAGDDKPLLIYPWGLLVSQALHVSLLSGI